jgi:hypothetical protein
MTVTVDHAALSFAVALGFGAVGFEYLDCAPVLMEM